MTILVRLGDTAPDFTAPTTAGTIDFHRWLGDYWCVLFSHTTDFTPVCTSQPGEAELVRQEFDRRKVKVISLGVDAREARRGWVGDIRRGPYFAPSIAHLNDTDQAIAGLYGMANIASSHTVPVRRVLVIGPDKKVQLVIACPQRTRYNFEEVLRVVDKVRIGAA
jgi:alkyl hydroperoxide reductase subunit AhpC